jgi:hypothetical protein
MVIDFLVFATEQKMLFRLLGQHDHHILSVHARAEHVEHEA